MASIEKGLHSLHAQSRESIGAQSDMDVSEPAASLPDTFAVIDVVSSGSPAQTAGLKVGDAVVSFGSVDTSNFNGDLKAIAGVVQTSQDKNVRVQVVRDRRVVTLTLKPQRWSGRGLLGCNIKPLEDTVER